jgi:hypothetical protein
MGAVRLPALALAVLCALGVTIVAAELKAPTLAAFDRYVALSEARMTAEAVQPSTWLWIDRLPPDARTRAAAELRAGQVVVEKLETKDKGQSIPVPDGLIHHWIGTVLMPGVTVDHVIGFIREYQGYPAAFGPMIRSAKVEFEDADHYRVAMRTETHKVITVVLDAQYDVDYRQVGPSRVFVKTSAHDVKEIDSPGTTSERATPAETGRGYVWRINTYCSFDGRPEGTYEQCESISLSRGLPFGIGWMISPFVTSVPRETLEFTLGHVRAALVK